MIPGNPIHFIDDVNTQIWNYDESLGGVVLVSNGFDEIVTYDDIELFSTLNDIEYNDQDDYIPVIETMLHNLENKIKELSSLCEAFKLIKENS